MPNQPFRGTAPFFLLSAALIAGTVIGLAAWNGWGAIAALAGMTALLSIVLRAPAAVTSAVVMAFCGVMSAGRTGFVDPGTVAPFLEKELVFRGWVDSVRATDSGWAGYADNVVVSTMDGALSLRVKKMAVFIRNPDRSVRFPAELRATGRLHPIRSPGNPAEIPREWEALASGAQFAFSADATKAILVSKPDRDSIFPAARSRTEAWLSRVAGTSDGAIYLLSLATGQAPPPGHPVVALFRNTGLAHLFAISGVNVVIFHAMLSVILRCLAWSVLRRRGSPDLGRFASIASLPACWAYVAMAGAPVPAVRSAGMITAAVLLWTLFRSRGAGFGFALLFLAAVAVSPFSIFTPSFLLSYSAVFFLILSTSGATEAARDAINEGKRLGQAKKWCLATVEGAVVAFFGTLPVAASFFQAIPATAILWNVLFCPILGTGGVAGAFLAVVGGVAGIDFLESPVRGIADFMTHCIRILRNLSAGVAWYPPVPPAGSLAPAVAMLSAVAGALWLRARGRRAWPAPVASALLFLCWIHLPYAAMPDHRMTLVALNVPNGASHVVFFPGGGTMVLDCGSQLRGDSGRRVLLPFLRYSGARRVGLLVLSHPHEDHYGGVEALLESMPVDEIWIPAGVKAERFGKAVAGFKGRIRSVGKGDTFRRGDAVVAVRSAGDGAVSGGNGESLVIEVGYGSFSAWLPGDVEGGPAAWGPVPKIKRGKRILFLPHHGSPGADPEGWVAAASPDVSVIQNKNCLGGKNLITSGKIFALENGALFARTDGRTVLVGQEAAHPIWSRICRLY
jgi:competence protein ComEC